MPAAPEHPDEAARLIALADYDVIGGTGADDFDDIAELAARICAVPSALVTFLDAERQWVRAARGFEGAASPEVARGDSLCDHALHSDGLLVIPDLAADPRTADNPFVTGSPGLRFYAGAPLRTAKGLPLGALCVLDTVPRQLSEAQFFALRTLGRQVIAQLELRRALRSEVEAVRRAEAQAAELQRLLATEQMLKLEIDHRVKNSLQLVSSLLQMQAARTPSAEIRAELLAARNRVAAISTIHAALNRGGHADRVRLDEYAGALVADLAASAPAAVRIDLEADPILLPTSQASSLAILLNEFVTNSLKYAFPDGRPGRVALSIRRQGDRLAARFADDGVGHAAPAGPAREGLGTRIMHAVGDQLGAKIEIVADRTGTVLEFDFPIEAPQPQATAQP